MNKKIIIPIICVGLLILIIIIGTYETKTKLTLGEYTGFEIEVEEIVVTDKDINDALIDDIIAEQEDVNITNRAVRKGDTVKIDFIGKVDGVEFENGSSEDYELEIGSGQFIDGFEEQIIGMEIGQTADLTVTFPDPYSKNPDLAGKEAVFTVTLNSFVGKEVPANVTDEMVKEISDTYTTVSEYKEYLRSKLEEEAEAQNNYNVEEAIWNMVVKNTIVDSISSKKMRYYSTLFESYYQYLADMNGISLTELIKNWGMTTADFNSEKKYYGEALATKYAISDAIALEEEISVTEDEFQAYLDEEGVTTDEKKEYGESMRDEFLYQKVIEFLISKSNVTMISKA